MRDDAFDRLWEAHANQLLGFLVHRTGDTALAEDVMAETFERVLRARRHFNRRKASEKTWLYSIAINLLRDHWRRKGAEARALEAVAATPERTSIGVDQVDERDSLMGALAALSDEEREAVALRYGADLTLPQIAKLTSEPLTKIEGRVYRGLRKLRDLLDD